MMPPSCDLCRKDHHSDPDEKFRLIYFKLTPEQAAKKQRMKDRRMVGHPPGAHWFCAEHFALMEPLQNLEYKQARAELRKPKGVFARIKTGFKKIFSLSRT
ncbi:MAG: hypothetical protein HKN36_06560 [Hellea sp.]|nr:hypothetical protein [Hellea sp.]